MKNVKCMVIQISELFFGDENLFIAFSMVTEKVKNIPHNASDRK
jgi:hypothetical protein